MNNVKCPLLTYTINKVKCLLRTYIMNKVKCPLLVYSTKRSSAQCWSITWLGANALLTYSMNKVECSLLTYTMNKVKSPLLTHFKIKVILTNLTEINVFKDIRKQGNSMSFLKKIKKNHRMPCMWGLVIHSKLCSISCQTASTKVNKILRNIKRNIKTPSKYNTVPVQDLVHTQEL